MSEMRNFTGKGKRVLFFGRDKCTATEELLSKLMRYDFDVTFVKSRQRGEKLPEDIFWWEAILPTETFLPPHFHSTQDKHLYITDGELDIVVDGKEVHATVGQIYSFPLQSTHSLFNNSGKTVKGVFWVEPTNRLFELFKAIHNVVDFSEVVRVSDAHDVHFQLPD